MLVDEIRNSRVCIVGDVMLDRLVTGAVERVSPEGPALVLQIDEERLMLGGAGNVAANIASLGGVAHLVSVMGDDQASVELERLMDAFGNLIVKGSLRVPDIRTTEKTRFVADGRHLLRADREQHAISESHEEAVIAALTERVEDCNALVISDYSKGVISPSVMRAAAAAARSNAIPLVIDSKRPDSRLDAGGTLVTPNVKELESATRIACARGNDCEGAALEMIRVTRSAVLVTRSEHGVSLYRPGHPVWSESSRATVVRDVTGAGDTVVATAAAALAVGVDMVEAAHIANVAAGIVVGKPGTAAVTLDELNLALLHGSDPAELEGKLVTMRSAVATRRLWQQAGLAVGLANGCFDLIHPGHVRLLAEARRRCDRLIVAINTDAAVRRLKGPERPIQTELARAEVIGALRSVDLVILFDDNTPIDLITSLRPDVLFKGADYSIEAVVGAEFVIGLGGRVELIEQFSEYSSTRLIARSRVHTR
jgi:D-beta-D-heptose 7-phosphate kinase/D-beta-D-heptose 1-phosphate adenosyltransferase